jgi:hypothetical protein
MGASRNWQVVTRTEHTVQVQHATHSGRVRIAVDGETIFEQSSPEALWDTGFHHEFSLDGLPCRLAIGFSAGSPTYELVVGGRRV